MKYLPQLKSRVSRRIFLAVLLCALIPIGSLIILTVQNVRSNLEADTARRLHHAGKNIGMALVTEFVSIDKALRHIASFHKAPKTSLIIEGNKAMPGEEILAKLWLFSDKGSIKNNIPKLSEQIKARLNRNLPQLVVERVNQQIQIFLWSPATDMNGLPVIAVGQINPTYLEEYALNFLPLNSQLSVLDSNLNPLMGNYSDSLSKINLIPSDKQSKHRYTEVLKEGETWLVGHWSLFLQAAFNTPNWHILVSEPKVAAFSSMQRFVRNAGLAGIFAFWVILLASSILIRKTLQPLQQLKEATQEISHGHFNDQVQLQSRDEFEELSVSFNQMATKIQRQISQQKNMSQSVRMILGASEEEEVITNFLQSVTDLTTVNLLSLALFNNAMNKMIPVWLKSGENSDSIEYLPNTLLSNREIEVATQVLDKQISVTDEDFPSLLNALARQGGKYFSLYSIEYKPSMFAIISLAHSGKGMEESDILTIRQLADQLGVALSRAEGIKDLDALNLGILTALARTVDANSRWTLGHSERVTQYALATAEAMGLSEAECLDLHRAGLLHDLGKVAVPAEILNKPGKLTKEEFEIIKKHPTEAARIIEPIQVFDNIRPIVRQHHERWDGGGYPDQLKGAEIHLGARILAVADVYDALYSERPYRAGWSQQKALDYLNKEAGKAFDPEVVTALCKVVLSEESLSA